MLLDSCGRYHRLLLHFTLRHFCAWFICVLHLTLARALSLSRYTVAVFVQRVLWIRLVLQTGAYRQLIMLYLLLCHVRIRRQVLGPFPGLFPHILQ